MVAFKVLSKGGTHWGERSEEWVLRRVESQQRGYSAQWVLSTVSTQHSEYSAEWNLSRVGTQESGPSAGGLLSQMAAQDANSVRISILTPAVPLFPLRVWPRADPFPSLSSRFLSLK